MLLRFADAHTIQVRITNLANQEQQKFKEENEKKIRAEIQKLSTKQENEINAFKLKMKLAFDEYKKKRALEYDV